MEEQRNHAVLCAATLFCARKAIEANGVGQAEFGEGVFYCSLKGAGEIHRGVPL
jgi:hypothetical protein